MERIELAEGIMRRFSGLKSAREPWVSTWQELADYMLPRKRPVVDGSASAHAGDELIFDSTPVNALEMLASALGGLLTNPATRWFEIGMKNSRTAPGEKVRAFMLEARERMSALFNNEDTGFQTHVHELYLDIALMGTGAMYVEADSTSVVRFSTRPLGEMYVAESARGVVDTVFRRYELTLRQAAQEWGVGLSEEVCSRVDEHPEERIEILHAVFPRSDRDPFGLGVAHFPWASVYLEISTGHVLEQSGYMEMPFLVPRWSKASGDTYGRGPGLTALSDVRVLNAMARTALMAAEKMSDPPLMVPDDGFLGPVRSGPGGLSYYRAGTQDRIEPLPVNSDLRAAEDMMAQRRDSIRRIFLNDRITPDEGPGLSATEAVIRQSERLRVLGPVMGRMQTEFLSPLVNRVFRVMLRAGVLPPLPEGLSADDFEVRHTSPMTRAQRQQEVQGLKQVMEYLMPLAGEGDEVGIMDNFDADRVVRHAAELFGVPADLLRTESEVVRARQEREAGRSRTQIRQRTLQDVGEVVRLAGELAKMDIEQPSALTALLGMVGKQEAERKMNKEEGCDGGDTATAPGIPERV